MLDAYKKLEANGVIGRMMKVDARGHEIIDPSGEQAGTLVVRPFVEFPKVIRRAKRDGGVIETIVHSKKEELRLLAENPDEFNDIPRSPLERERDALAQENAALNKTLSTMEMRMEAMMAQVASLSSAVNKRNAEDAALGTGAPPVTSHDNPPETPAATTGRGIEALATKGK